MRIARSLLGLAYLMLGAALGVAFMLLALGLMSPILAAEGGPPTAPVIAATVALAAVLSAAVALVPAVRRIEGVAAESMLGVVFDGGPPEGAARRSDRVRCVAWLWAHLLAGATFVGALIVLPALLLEVSGWLVAPAFVAALALGEVLARGLGLLAPGLLGRSLHERIAGLEQEARELGQRNRIAREIHDSIGHALSLVTVQAAAARRVQHTDPAFVSEALTAIEGVGRSATAELDHALGLLRADAGPEPPVPGLDGLPDLVAATSRAGLATTLDSRLDPAELAALSPVVARELYRIAQEGLANAIRHGTSPCRVLLQRRGRDVVLEITNSGGPGGRRRGRRTGGSGVPGMVERARALGGSAAVGAVEGDWSVSVAVPWLESR